MGRAVCNEDVTEIDSYFPSSLPPAYYYTMTNTNHITLDVTKVGPSIHNQAAHLIASASVPTVVTMQFVGGGVRKMYTHSVATDGDVQDARDYLRSLVENHDYTYDYSDDYGVWLAGRANEDRIASVRDALVKRGIDVTDIMDFYYARVARVTAY